MTREEHIRRQERRRKKERARRRKMLLMLAAAALAMILLIAGIVVLIVQITKKHKTAKPPVITESVQETTAETAAPTMRAEPGTETKTEEETTEEAEEDFRVEDGFRYLYLPDGTVATGHYTDAKGNDLLFTPDGKQYLNCVGECDGKVYFCDENGYIVKNQDITFPDGSTGKATEDGSLLTGSVLIGNEVYTFTSHGRFRHKIDATKPMIALTYDDGPSTKNTQAILDILVENGAYGTFFVCGRNIERTEDLIQAIENSGSETGNHTFNHYMLSCMDFEVTNQEISTTSSMVQMITGNRPSIVRPPTGSLNEQAYENAKNVDNGYPLILWNIDTLDWQHHDSQESCRIIREKAADGAIVLMHDMEDSNVETTRIIVPELISQGYQLVSVSELAAARGGMEPGNVYNSFPK